METILAQDAEQELDDVALNLCEINTASWSSVNAPISWGVGGGYPKRCCVARAPLADLVWDSAATGSSRVGGVGGAVSSHLAPAPHDFEAAHEEPAHPGHPPSYHDINSESWSSKGSGVAANLNFCDINTASWSSRESRTHLFAALGANVRTRSTDHGARGNEDPTTSHLHESNACSWRSRGSAPLNLCEINTASWGSTNSKLFAGMGASRRPARSVKDLLEDFALLHNSSSESSTAEAPRSSDDAPSLKPKRLEAGSIAALQAELANCHGHSSRMEMHLSSLMHPMWAKYGSPGDRDHGHSHAHSSCPSAAVLAASQARLPDSCGWEPSPPSEQSRCSAAFEPFRFTFKVPVAKLESRDKQVLSERFHIVMGDMDVPFKVRAIAKHVHRHKHGQCFRTSRGRGRLELKCEGDLPDNAKPLTFAFSVGSGENVEGPRGPVTHDFRSNSVGCLPVTSEEWDFKTAAGTGAVGCVITLEVLPTHRSSSQVGPHGSHGEFATEGLGGVVNQGNDELSFSPGGYLSTIAEDPPENC